MITVLLYTCIVTYLDTVYYIVSKTIYIKHYLL